MRPTNGSGVANRGERLLLLAQISDVALSEIAEGWKAMGRESQHFGGLLAT
jgi:hypothetical protein